MSINETRAFEIKLPYGTELTDMLSQNYISEANINKLLQKKGVFFGLREKRFSIPLLSASLLTPSEFEYIREKRNTKEDSIKRRSSVLPWTSEKKLIEAFPKDIDVKELTRSDFLGYEIIGAPSFRPHNGNKNKMLLEYEIKRSEGAKGWASSESTFNGSIEIELRNKSVEVCLTKCNTSSETEDVNNKVVAAIKKNLKSIGCIGNDEYNVLFSSFNNEKRIEFFWKLTGEINNGFMTFDRITDIDVKPDNNKTIPSNLDIKWMANNINRLHINGERIQDTHFISNKKCHPYLIIWHMEAKYSFDDHVAKGNCRINYEFSNYGKTGSDSSEFTISISQLKLNKEYRHVNKRKIQDHLLEKIDHLKTQIFRDYLKFK